MATLVLTVAGGLIGGPVGAAIGAAAGNAVDHALFPPKAREGPRLSDLRVQTASYGTPLPRLFGTMRVAGCVIWSTDLIEHRDHESGGKGQPGVTRYSYSASFAVALSARPILSVGRIWADGKLLRGAAGDFKTQTGFRLHPGGEDQAPDPLIAAIEGAGLAPAHRGLAYAVFEDLALADFGNRIPALTFEVTADAGAVPIHAIAAELGAGLVQGEALTALDGFSAWGSARDAIALLADAAGAWTAPAPGAIRLRGGSGAARTLADAGARRGTAGAPPRSRAIAAADSTPVSLTLCHYDPARDWQLGMQRATRPGPGLRTEQIALPAALGAGAAKTIAEAVLARRDLERERRSLSLGPEALDVAPGDRVRVAGEPGLWRVAAAACEAMVVTLDCVRIAPAPLPATATGGRALAAPDETIGATILAAFELPPTGDGLATAPQLGIAANGAGAGWRRAALLLSTDGGGRWTPAGTTAAPAVLGSIVTAPGTAPALLADHRHVLVVALAQDAMTLGDADDAALDAGANLAMAGEELLQFARAEPLGARRWRLSGLWRGRRGTETAIGTQAAGDRFVLLASATLAVRDVPPGLIGGTARILAQGVGDAIAGVAGSGAIDGRSVLPPAPVHLTAQPGPDGTTLVRWIRRSRVGWRWLDDVDAPLGEEREAWRVTIAPDGAERVIETDAPLVVLAAADRTGSCRVGVRQVGGFGLSGETAILLPPL